MSTQRQFILGIFFLTALSILGFYTLFLTDFTLFREPEEMVVYFPEAHDLREGNPVLVSGLRVGKVTELRYDVRERPERRIKAVLSLTQHVDLYHGAEIRIEESTFLGGRHVNIEPGLYGEGPMEAVDGAYLGSVRKNPLDALGDIGTLVSENSATFSSILESFDDLMAGIRAGEGVLGRLANDETLGKDLVDSVADVRRITGDVRDGKGILGALIYDPSLLESVRGSIDSLAVILEDVQRGKGVAGRLLADEEMGLEVEAAVKNFRELSDKLNSGEGTLGMLFSDEQFEQELRSVVAEFKQASEDLQTVARNVRNGEGSLGKLLMDDELYDEAITGLKLLTRSLEDYREAAPITAFTGVLFSAF